VTESAAIPRRPSTLLLITNISGGHLAMTIVLPSLPAMALALTVDAATMQLAFTLYIAAFAASQLVAGPLSDRFGRRPVLLWGQAMFAAASLVCALTTNVWVLIAARMVQSTGACTGMVVTRGLIRDVYGDAHTGRVLGYAAMAMGTAPAIAPVIGGHLEVWFGWRASMWLIAAYATLALIATWTMLAETRERTAPTGGAVRAMLSGFAILIRSPSFLCYAAVGASLSGTYFAFVSSAPLVFIGAFGGHAGCFQRADRGPAGGLCDRQFHRRPFLRATRSGPPHLRGITAGDGEYGRVPRTGAGRSPRHDGVTGAAAGDGSLPRANLSQRIGRRGERAARTRRHGGRAGGFYPDRLRRPGFAFHGPFEL